MLSRTSFKKFRRDNESYVALDECSNSAAQDLSISSLPKTRSPKESLNYFPSDTTKYLLTFLNNHERMQLNKTSKKFHNLTSSPKMQFICQYNLTLEKEIEKLSCYKEGLEARLIIPRYLYLILMFVLVRELYNIAKPITSMFDPTLCNNFAEIGRPQVFVDTCCTLLDNSVFIPLLSILTICFPGLHIFKFFYNLLEEAREQATKETFDFITQEKVSHFSKEMIQKTKALIFITAPRRKVDHLKLADLIKITKNYINQHFRVDHLKLADSIEVIKNYTNQHYLTFGNFKVGNFKDENTAASEATAPRDEGVGVRRRRRWSV